MNRLLTNRIYIVLLWGIPLFASCDLPIDLWLDKSTTVTVSMMGGALTVTPPPPPVLNLKQQYPSYFQEASIINSIAIPELWVQVQNLQAGNAATQVAGSITISDPSDMTFTPITISYGTTVDANGIPVDANGVDIPGAAAICTTPFLVGTAPNQVLTCGVPILEGGRVDLTPNPDLITSLETQIKKTGNIALVYTGSIDATPALFDLQGQIHIVASVSVGGSGGASGS